MLLLVPNPLKSQLLPELRLALLKRRLLHQSRRLVRFRHQLAPSLQSLLRQSLQSYPSRLRARSRPSHRRR